LERRPLHARRSFEVLPLAQGEYNLNYLITAGSLRLVFRVNIGTQINRKDQVVYEYKALRLLEGSGSPPAYFVDDSRRFFDRGILIMEFLPGEPSITAAIPLWRRRCSHGFTRPRCLRQTTT